VHQIHVRDDAFEGVRERQKRERQILVRQVQDLVECLEVRDEIAVSEDDALRLAGRA
jgi:hypothetical protein